tara:strand:+ start:14140 stop:14877 length:738 start_codon:yes stop_codon:yes gene_type:complete
MGAWLAERPEIRETVKEIKEALASVKLEAGITPLGNKATRSGLLAMLPHGTFKPQHKAGTITAQNTAICQIIGSMSDCNVPDPWEVDVDGPPPRNTQLWAVWNGLRLEPEAEEAFEAATGLSIEKVGFCEHYSKFAGCSPDGLILGENIGFEGKAPLPQTHQKYCMEVRETGTVPDTYRDQVHGSMAVTGADAWWFQSYCPGLPAVRVLVKRDDYTEAMQLGLIEFGDALKAEVKITLAELEEQS